MIPKILLFATLIQILPLGLFSQPPIKYSNEKEFKDALSIYNDRLASHLNYEKKISYYLNAKLSSQGALEKTNEEWVSFFRNELSKRGIFFDNHLVRYKPNVQPDGEKWIHLSINNNSDILKVTLGDFPDNGNEIYYASTYFFKHPGLPPVFVPETPKKKQSSSLKKKDKDLVKVDSVIMSQPVKEPIKVKSDLYLMPDGKRYTRAELKSVWGMDEKMVDENFKGSRGEK